MHRTTQVQWNSSLNPLVASSGSETLNLQLLCLCYCLLTGCGHLRWLWPAPAGCLPLPPSGHSHCPVLQVQVQQRRWWPIANLNTPQGLEWRAAPRKGHLFFLFTPLPPFTFFPSQQLWVLHFSGWACTSPPSHPVASGSIALHERGMVEKRPYTFGLKRGAGSKVRGGRTCLRTTVSMCVRRWWLGMWRKTGPLFRGLTVGLLWCGIVAGH